MGEEHSTAPLGGRQGWLRSGFAFSRRWLNLALGRVKPDSENRRATRILQSVVTGLGTKAVAVVVSFISVPLTVGYLGAERYGVWIIISTLLAWINLADFGLGNSLTNALSEAYGKDRRDLAQQHVATASWLLVGILTVLGCGLAACWGWIDWIGIFNIKTAAARAEAGPAVAVALALFLVNLPLTLVSRILYAHQEGVLANLWTAAGNLASLLGLLLVVQFQGGLVWLVVGISGAIVLVSALSAIWLFAVHKPWLRPDFSKISKASARQISRVGGLFFILQLAGLILFQTDNLIIAHYLGAEAVTPYSITWRLFTYTALLQTLIFPSLWPAYAEAFARKDGAWIRRTFRLNFVFAVASTFALALPLVIFGTTVIERWAGAAAVPPQSLLLWMGVWSVLSAAMESISCLLSSSGQLRGQPIYASVTAGANLVLSATLIHPFGITGVIAATVISYMLFNVVPALVVTRAVLKETIDAT